MRKLPWQDQEVKDYVICCMINIWNVKYNSIHCVANLLAGLVLYQEDVGIHVVDGVLEDIRLGMEVTRLFFKVTKLVFVENLTFKSYYWNNNLKTFLSHVVSSAITLLELVVSK